MKKERGCLGKMLFMTFVPFHLPAFLSHEIAAYFARHRMQGLADLRAYSGKWHHLRRNMTRFNLREVVAKSIRTKHELYL